MRAFDGDWSPAPRGSLAGSLVALLVVLVVGAVALLSVRPPAPLAADAPTTEFSAARAMETVLALAGGPRPLGSPGSDQARDVLVELLRAHGATVSVQRAAAGWTAGGSAAVARVDNVVAVLPGTRPTGAVVLAAHYDSVAAGPGAADDAAGVAAVVETLRAVAAGPRPRNDVVALLTDGEEPGLLGAGAFVRADPLRGRPAVVLNLEARGVSGPSTLARTSPGNERLIRTFAAAAPHAVGDSALNEIFRFVPNDTDVSPFLSAGRPALDFALVEGASRYHTAQDDPAHLSRASLQHHGSNLLGVTRALDDTDLAPFDPATSGAPPSRDATYFPFLGLFVTYPEGLALPLAGLAALALIAAAAVAVRRGLVAVRRVWGGVASVAVLVVVAGLAGQAAWEVLVLLRPDYAEGVLPGFPLRPLPARLAVLLLAGTALAAWAGLFRRRIGAWGLGIGGLGWLTLLGGLTAVVAPGMSFAFALPALGGALGVLAAALLPSRARPVAVAVGAVPSLALLWPFVVSTFDAGLSAAPIVAALAVLLGATLAPLVAGLRVPRRGAPVLVALPLVAAVGLAGTGVLVHRPDAEHPRQADLAYVLDASDGSARWFSRDPDPAAWVAGYTPETVDGPGADLPPAADGALRTGPAPAVDLAAPTVRAERGADGTIVLTVQSARGAPTLGVSSSTGMTRVEATFDGLDPVDLDLQGAPLDLAVHDVPASGVRLVLHPVDAGQALFDVHDRSVGLDAVPGYTPRPPDLAPSSRPASDTVSVATTVAV
ncbi:M28 family peptidase [Modestobacter marinus]|uniref:M28 family peptidase n=1 Tax=Modestobacter marinus TaxID=477641 RepID=UPI001C96B1DA|nr:M28 family peptidase [Modestobacter marinus]